MKVYFVRHGESQHNAEKAHQALDVSLSETGRKQAEIVAERFKVIKVDTIISSDYPRAKETAEIIGQVIGKKPIFTELARERRLPSEVCGKSVDDPALHELKKKIEQNIHDPNFHYSDEENFYDIKERAKQLLKFVSNSSENILVVLHGTILRYVMASMMYGDNFDWDIFHPITKFFWLDNTGITFCEEVEGVWKMKTWNDRAHLGEIG